MKRRRSSSYACPSAGRVTAQLLLSFLAACPHQASAVWTDGWINGANQLPMIPLPESTPQSQPSPPPAPAEHDFTLRHIFHHGTYLHPKLHRRLDVRPQDSIWMLEDDGTDKEPQRSFRVRSRGETIQRLADRRYEVVDALMSSARLSGYATTTDISAWTMDEVSAPNVTDKDTVLSLANMAANAYIKVPGTENWVDVDAGFNVTDDFGWESDGLRGHIFADEGNETIVIGLKGTTPGTHFSLAQEGRGILFKYLMAKRQSNLFFQQLYSTVPAPPPKIKKTTTSSSAAAAAKAAITSGAKSATATPQPTPATRPACSRPCTRRIATTKPRRNFTGTSQSSTHIPMSGCRDTPSAARSAVSLA